MGVSVLSGVVLFYKALNNTFPLIQIMMTSNRHTHTHTQRNLAES